MNGVKALVMTEGDTSTGVTLFACCFLCVSCTLFLLLSTAGFWAVGGDWMIQFIHFGLRHKTPSLMIHGDCLWHHPRNL